MSTHTNTHTHTHTHTQSETLQTLNQKSIPEQWKMSKIIPLFKKGDKTNITNYRPIANLCALSKVFEKLVLKRIMEIEDTNKTDLTGAGQHGFKRNHSTSTAGHIR